MESQKNRFVRAFQTSKKYQIENIDPLTHSLPPRHIQLSDNVIRILQQVRDTVICVAAFGLNTSFFQLTRKMLDLDTIHEEANSKKHNNNFNELYLATKIDFVPKQRFKWVYGQMKLRKYDKEEKLSPIYLGNHELYQERFQVSSLAALMGSPILFVQISCLSSGEQMLAYLKKYNEKMSDLPGSFPKVYFLLDLKQQKQFDFQQMLSNTKLKIAYETIVIGEWTKNWDQEFRLRNMGKGIIENLRPKVISGIAINERFITILWSLLALQEDKSVYNCFNEAHQMLMHEQSQQALNSYVSRIEEMTDDGLIRSQFFKDTEPKLRTDIMRQVTQRTGAVSERDDIMKTERRLLEMREQMEVKNQKAVIDWGKNLLRQSWGAMEKRMGKQTKTISTLKQQVSIIVEFFRKKSEKYLSIQLLIVLLDFLIPKIIETAQGIYNNAVNSLKEKQQASQAQLVSYTSEIKDLRKKVSKEQGEQSRKIMDLKQKNFILQANFKKTEKALQQITQQLQQNKQIYEQRITKMSEQHKVLLQKKQKMIDELVQKAETNLKRITLLQNQLNKQKLLHKQTRQFYQEGIQNLKTRQVELREQLEEFSLSASREIDLMKCSSTKEIDTFQILNDQLMHKIATLEHQIVAKDQALEKTKVQLLRLKEENKEKEFAFIKISQLQLRNKVLEEYEQQCGLLRVRIKKAEDQIKKVQRQKQQKTQQCRQKETKSLIISQKYEYLGKCLQQQKSKSKLLINQLQMANKERQELDYELKLSKQKVMNDFSCQVEDNSVKQKLKIAIEMIKEIESQYAKLKAQNQRHYRRNP